MPEICLWLNIFGRAIYLCIKYSVQDTCIFAHKRVGMENVECWLLAREQRRLFPIDDMSNVVEFLISLFFARHNQFSSTNKMSMFVCLPFPPLSKATAVVPFSQPTCAQINTHRLQIDYNITIRISETYKNLLININGVAV